MEVCFDSIWQILSLPSYRNNTENSLQSSLFPRKLQLQLHLFSAQRAAECSVSWICLPHLTLQFIETRLSLHETGNSSQNREGSQRQCTLKQFLFSLHPLVAKKRSASHNHHNKTKIKDNRLPGKGSELIPTMTLKVYGLRNSCYHIQTMKYHDD